MRTLFQLNKWPTFAAPGRNKRQKSSIGTNRRPRSRNRRFLQPHWSDEEGGGDDDDDDEDGDGKAEIGDGEPKVGDVVQCYFSAYDEFETGTVRVHKFTCASVC